jgi:hypothetical protein
VLALNDRPTRDFISQDSSSSLPKLSRRQATGLGAATAASLLLAPRLLAAAAKQHVAVWSEGTAPKEMYPKDINGAVAEGLKPLADWDILPLT